MRILGLESSAKAASVALSVDGKLIAQYWQHSGLTHSKTLLKMTEDMLSNLGLQAGDLDVVSVASGPGSFTGVRIGVAAAKGLAWAAGKLVCGVSTLEAMAWQLSWANGVICPVMDARRGQIYNAKFEIYNGEMTRLCPDRAVSLDELLQEIKNSKKTHFFVGDGAEVCYNTALGKKLNVCLAPEPFLLQSAWGVVKAAEYCKPEQPDDLIPNYLRLSQAERERLARENNLGGK